MRHKWNAAGALKRRPLAGEHDGVRWDVAARRIMDLNAAVQSGLSEKFLKDHLEMLAPCLAMAPFPVSQ